jgi:hypothetical protein
LTWQNPLTFVFLYYNNVFLIFLKIKIDPGNPVTWSKPGTRALDRACHLTGFKNSGQRFYIHLSCGSQNKIEATKLTFYKHQPKMDRDYCVSSSLDEISLF